MHTAMDLSVRVCAKTDQVEVSSTLTEGSGLRQVRPSCSEVPATISNHLETQTTKQTINSRNMSVGSQRASCRFSNDRAIAAFVYFATDLIACMVIDTKTMAKAS